MCWSVSSFHHSALVLWTVGRGNAEWTTSKSGQPCPCQNHSQGPPAEKTGRRFLLNHPSRFPPRSPSDPTGQGTEKNWTCEYFFSYLQDKQQSLLWPQTCHGWLSWRWWPSDDAEHGWCVTQWLEMDDGSLHRRQSTLTHFESCLTILSNRQQNIQTRRHQNSIHQTEHFHFYYNKGKD